MKEIDYKFSTPLLMPCTFEQFRCDLQNILIDVMGYWGEDDLIPLKSQVSPLDVCDELYITNDYFCNKGALCIREYKYFNFTAKRFCISEYHPELFLALAAMTDSTYGIPGEYWTYIGDPTTNFKVGSIYKSARSLDEYKAFIADNACEIGFGCHNLKYFRKAEMNEIIEHFGFSLDGLEIKRKVDYSKGYVVIAHSKREGEIVSSHIKNQPQQFTCKWNFVIYDPNNSRSIICDIIPKNYQHFPKLTFQEFEEKILKLKKIEKTEKIEDMSKTNKSEISGYKVPYDIAQWDLKKDLVLSKEKLHLSSCGKYYKYPNNYSSYNYSPYNIPVEIVHSWEIVCNEYKTIEIGAIPFELTIHNGRCHHKYDDITDFVKRLMENFQYHKKEFTFSGFSCVIDDIVFKKTGCQETTTTLSEWINVYQEMINSENA